MSWVSCQTRGEANERGRPHPPGGPRRWRAAAEDTEMPRLEAPGHEPGREEARFPQGRRVAQTSQGPVKRMG